MIALVLVAGAVATAVIVTTDKAAGVKVSKVVGDTVDKMNAMPKKVGRLLPKMLSVDPAERPGDPLAFYRELQDCLTDLSRRETTPRPAASAHTARAPPARPGRP